jgi:NDP-sugar pyrophosphorylase family protein
VEQKALRPEQADLGEVNSGIYCFERRKVAPLLRELGRDNPDREYYLTDLIGLLRERGETVSAYRAPAPDEILGANTAAELAWVDALLRQRKAEALMASGVTLYQPESQAIDPEVFIGPDSVIERGVELRGATRIGRRCRIGAFSILENSVLADDVTVRSHCLVLNSRLGAGVVVGPFAHLRDGADIRRGARIPSAPAPTLAPVPSLATTTGSTKTRPASASGSSSAAAPNWWLQCGWAVAPTWRPAPPSPRMFPAMRSPSGAAARSTSPGGHAPAARSWPLPRPARKNQRWQSGSPARRSPKR